MISERELLKNLKSIYKLLEKEKQALIKNQGDEIRKIVEMKTKYIENISRYEGESIKENSKAMKIIEKINSLQELNLLLTKQALSFQDELLSAISQNVQNVSNTYSPDGNLESPKNINLIDQSV